MDACGDHSCGGGSSRNMAKPARWGQNTSRDVLKDAGPKSLINQQEEPRTIRREFEDLLPQDAARCRGQHHAAG